MHPRHATFPLLLILAPLLLAACGTTGNRPKMTPALYTGLADKSVAIVIYTAQANTDEFPGARKDISNFVANNMRLHLPTTRLLNPDEVMNWQDDTINWYALAEKDIGKHFSVDRVLYIEVLTYEARNLKGYGDLQGTLRANCKVFEVDTPGDAPAWTGVIDVTWPRDRPVSASQTNEITIRTRTLQLFADALVGCFRERPNINAPISAR
jgi:hypothetical protein